MLLGALSSFDVLVHITAPIFLNLPCALFFIFYKIIFMSHSWKFIVKPIENLNCFDMLDPQILLPPTVFHLACHLKHRLLFGLQNIPFVTQKLFVLLLLNFLLMLVKTNLNCHRFIMQPHLINLVMTTALNRINISFYNVFGLCSLQMLTTLNQLIIRLWF